MSIRETEVTGTARTQITATDTVLILIKKIASCPVIDEFVYLTVSVLNFFSKKVKPPLVGPL